ncbi:hypothetical protein CP97_14772 [Aurantiacibacter atlanticus]|uniref:PDZ domain-containing protein n=2 Tax=Aurantiacibacter atlanticus TaxID=1648404 RepID=A0A168M288_9SPHN|nr:hypothetical protein CP97_14772 [Aurantiacibacter atlanticus]
MQFFRPKWFLAAVCMVLAGSGAIARHANAQDNAQWPALLREDLRVAAIGDSLLKANADLCRNTMPVTGMVLHSADQYGSGSMQARFANGPIAISTIVSGSSSAVAGLRPDDAIIAINGHPTDALAAPFQGNLREAAFALLASQPVGGPISMRIARGGSEQEFILNPPAGCHSLIEIRVESGPRARSDGQIIQIQYAFAGQLDDQQVAIVIAHELAHSVLEHRRRKEEAGIDNGLFAAVGKNRQANRRAEIEADRLSAHLLANAGYDPALVPAFWRSDIGKDIGGVLLESGIYPSHEARAQMVEHEIALNLPQRRGPTWPDHLLVLRDRGFAPPDSSD